MEKTWGGFVLRICLFLLQAERDMGTNVSQSDRSVPSLSGYSWNKQRSLEKGTQVKQKKVENQMMEKK